MTEAQIKALEMLARAYDEDVPVSLGTQTGKVNGVYTVSRRVARTLIRYGYARPTQTMARFLLATEGGLVAARAGLKAV